MQPRTISNLANEQLKRLDFLVGEYSSWHTMWPVGRSPVQYRSVVRAYREGCDRFLRLEQFSDVPGIGLVSSTTLFTFNRKEGTIDGYGFSSAHEEPLLRFRGTWSENSLVLVSEPACGYAGFERYRHSFTPKGECGWDFVEERWDLEGYARHISGTYLGCSV